MRKIILLAFAVAAVTTSCIKKTEITPEDRAISGGYYLYQIGRNSYNEAMAVSSVALRLNTLMAEAMALNDGDRNLNNEIKRTEGTATTDYKALLFGNATLQHENIDTPEEKITVNYPFDYNNTKDFGFSGSLEAYTRGSMLSDEDSPEWSFSIKPQTTFKIKDVKNNTEVSVEWDNYSIYNNAGEWVVSTSDFKRTSGNYSPSVNQAGCIMSFSNEVVLNPNFSNVYGKPLTVKNAYCSGNLINSDIEVHYKTTGDVVYLPSCNYRIVYMVSGTEEVTSADLHAADPETFPAATVKLVTTSPDNTTCGNVNWTLYYAGFQRTF